MFRGVNLKVWVALLVAGMAAAMVVVLLVDGTKPARAGAFPGTNGKIAFDTDRDGGNSEIYAMNPDGNQQTNLSRSVADISASYSANGKKIAFSSVRDGNSEIYSMNANGTLQTRLTRSHLINGKEGDRTDFASTAGGVFSPFSRADAF